MVDPLQTILIVASLLLAVVTGVYIALDRSPDKILVAVIAVLEVGLLVQAVIGIAQVVGGGDDLGITFVGYLLAVLVVLPAGVLWSLGERSRGATAVLLVALLTAAFLVLRLVQLRAAA
ncbi:MAG: hypothetical protein AVDCRST_MAG60-404 [uncultured Nocardioides sp.]|uniref:Integral membrane protein n=1 Tax=uncultured Nocardioides sp. TaxID=198441 RepID=A0A6J4N0Y6_9ACTN|nr:MAG: hypothetical protein AVDCRST_MAG60-404 [uncultured Nocardioides sp.]